MSACRSFVPEARAEDRSAPPVTTERRRSWRRSIDLGGSFGLASPRPPISRLSTLGSCEERGCPETGRSGVASSFENHTRQASRRTR
jgi:hypothetical protein